MLERLIAAGCDVVRINFWHGDVETHARRVKLVRAAARELDADVGVLADLAGPRIRIDRVRGGSAMLRAGAKGRRGNGQSRAFAPMSPIQENAMKSILPVFFVVLVNLPVQAGWAASEMQQLERADGGTVHWYLDRRGETGEQGIVLLAQGSGCSSPIHGQAMKAAASLAPDHAILMIEKAGVPPGYRPGDEGCPASFHDQHTLTGWVADLERVIESLRESSWWNGELVLFGGSEGGAMVTLAAAEVPETRALIILSSGVGMTMAETLTSVVPPEATENLERQFEVIRANPDSSEVWSAHSYRWWYEVLDHDFMADLLAVNVPILLIQGGRDSSVPVASGRNVRDAFEQAGRNNLTYQEYPRLDHGMTNADGDSRLAEVIADAGEWLTGKND